MRGGSGTPSKTTHLLPQRRDRADLMRELNAALHGSAPGKGALVLEDRRGCVNVRLTPAQKPNLIWVRVLTRGRLTVLTSITVAKVLTVLTQLLQYEQTAPTV